MHLFLGNFLRGTCEIQETGDRRDAKTSPQITTVHKARAELHKMRKYRQHIICRKLLQTPDWRILSYFFIFYYWHYYRCPHSPTPLPTSIQPPLLFPQAIITLCLCLLVIHRCSLANPFLFFHPVLPPTPLWQLSVCLFHVSMLLFLFCSPVYFVH